MDRCVCSGTAAFMPYTHSCDGLLATPSDFASRCVPRPDNRESIQPRKRRQFLAGHRPVGPQYQLERQILPPAAVPRRYSAVKSLQARSQRVWGTAPACGVAAPVRRRKCRPRRGGIAAHGCVGDD
eukprot:366563-Chlamydomonas_euryale.AAC.6